LGPSEDGSVNEMSVLARGSRRDVLDDHVDVASGVGDRGEDVGGLPGRSGTPTTVILASLRSCATPAMIGASMVLPSP
jgi:hypothetical protein